MGDDGLNDDGLTNDVWKSTVERLNRRENPKWESLSWVALRPLISSLNDRVNRMAPRLVPELRTAWIQAMQTQAMQTQAMQTQAMLADGASYTGLIRRPETSCFLLMGDTGEQDASQYVLAPALEAAMNPPPEDGGPAADFLIICSDVIYPSGDINDYRHGFYLPYENLLPGKSSSDSGTGVAQRIYGLPGNHDWYDGLTGFMNTFCGVGELSRDLYALPKTPKTPEPPKTGPREAGRKALLLEGIGRVLWRRPSPAPQADALRRERMGALDPATAQPGPYYAIEVKGLLLVCIDGGIGARGDCEIDPDQGRWLLSLQEIKLPKVLLTGYPLLVNAEWKSCVITWSGAEAAGRPGTVNEIVADRKHGYVAAIGGDIHNFQRYDVMVGADLDHPVTYLVSGGGGAYLSATHPVPGFIAEAEAGLEPRAQAVRAQNARVGGPSDANDRLARLGPTPEPMIPDAPDSLLRFTEQVLPKTWRLLRSLIAFVAGALISTAVISASDERVVAGPALTVLLALLTLSLLFRIFVLGPPGVLELQASAHWRLRRRAYRAGLVAVVAASGAVVPLISARVGPRSWSAYLVSWFALSAVGLVLSMMQRRSGWWRGSTQVPDGPKAIWAAVFVGLALIAAPVVLVLADIIPFTGARALALIAAAFCIVLTAAGGWLARNGSEWRSRAQLVAIAAQVLAAGLLLSAVPGSHAAIRPLAVAAGLVLIAIVAVLALLLACVVMLGPGGNDGPRLRLARRGQHSGPLITLFGLGQLVALAALSNAIGVDGWLSSLLRIAVVVAWAVALVVIGVFGADALRRWAPSGYRWLSVGLGLGLATILVVAPLDDRWLAAGLIVSGLGLILAGITVCAIYLAFFGGHNLLFDLEAHQDLDDRDTGYLINRQQAEQVIEWRRTRGTTVVDDQRVLRRAKFVTPSTDKPQGLIQQKVSEFFSTDRPPFAQHFLKLRIVGSTLEITPHLVTGEAGQPAAVPQETIEIRLPDIG